MEIRFAKNHFVPVIIYTLSYIALPIPYLPMILLFFTTTLIASFYDENEEVEMLTRFGKTGTDIFITKCIMHVRFLLLLYLPVMALSSIIHTQIFIYNLMFLLSQSILIIFLLTTKYKHYTPQYSPIKNSNFTATMVLLSIMPIFFLIPGLYVLMMSKKSIQRINLFIWLT